jgi:hypothetical protein
MKKVSTRAAAQSRNISQQKLTVGLDLGDRNSWYCVVDEAGQIQLEQRVRTSANALQEVFGAMPRSRIALEIGTHSPWISRLLSELGHEVMVANARKVRLIGENRKKDDRLDAQTLARLARIDPELLYPVKHRSAQAQADLSVIRARAGLVRARTGLVNTARGLAKSYGERLRGCNVRNMNPEKAEGLSPELQRALEPLLSAIAELSERIENLAQQSYPQAPNRWQHRLNRERPTCIERNESLVESADGSMATVATRREKNDVPRSQNRIHLTPIGLLMEGHSTQIPREREDQ